MKEIIGNIWDLAKNKSLCITTNGYVKTNGCAVMERGMALQAQERFPVIDFLLGEKIKDFGNTVHYLGDFTDFVGVSYTLFSFPVKYYWREKGDMRLIKTSCLELVELISFECLRNIPFEIPTPIYLPRPGCGYGELGWEDVGPAIKPILDDRFVIVSPT